MYGVHLKGTWLTRKCSYSLYSWCQHHLIYLNWPVSSYGKGFPGTWVPKAMALKGLKVSTSAHSCACSGLGTKRLGAPHQCTYSVPSVNEKTRHDCWKLLTDDGHIANAKSHLSGTLSTGETKTCHNCWRRRTTGNTWRVILKAPSGEPKNTKYLKISQFWFTAYKRCLASQVD